MWIVLAFLSAVFTGISAVLAKAGIRRTDSAVATAIRTVTVLAVATAAALLTDSFSDVGSVTPAGWAVMVGSGLITGLSWLCYFRALSLGPVSRVEAVDKTSTVMVVLLALLLLGEPVRWQGWICLGVLVGGSYLASSGGGRGADGGKRDRRWLLYAFLGALFGALNSVVGKIATAAVNANAGTVIRTAIVLVMAWTVVAAGGRLPEVKRIPRRELAFIGLSGLFTGGSWVCYYCALETGLAGVVAPIDRLSVLVAVGLSCLFLHEKVSRRAVIGLGLLTAGTVGMVLAC